MAKILVVDDSAFIRMALKKILAEFKHMDIIEAASGEQAVAQVEKNKPDLILLDLVLPDISGDEVLDKIMKIDPGANVIMITAIGQKSIIDKCMKSGAKDYITKPFDNVDLLRRVKRVVGK